MNMPLTDPEFNVLTFNTTTRTVVVNSNFYGATTAPPRRVVVNSRLANAAPAPVNPIRVEQITPSTSMQSSRAFAHASMGPLTQQRLRLVPSASQPQPNGTIQPAHRRASHSLDDVNNMDYTAIPVNSSPQPVQGLRRPTTVVVTRTIRPTTLSYATSQRNALPVTVKLPSQSSLRVPRLSQVHKDPRMSVERPVSSVIQTSSARVRPIDPKYKDKSNRAFVAFRKEQQQKFAAAVDKRKREFPSHHYQLSTHMRQPSGSISSTAESKTSVSPKSEPGSTISNEYNQTMEQDKRIEEDLMNEEVKITVNGDDPREIPNVGTYIEYTQPQNHLQPTLTYTTHRASSQSSLASAPSNYDMNRYEYTGQTIDGQPVVKARRPGRPRKTDPPVIRPPKESKRKRLLESENGDFSAERKRKPKLHRRELAEEVKIIDSFVKNGFDLEDLALIRKQFEIQQLKDDFAQIPWKQQIPWRDYAVPPEPKAIPQPASFEVHVGQPEPYFADPELKDVVPNAHGCARAEPYRKREDGVKQRQKRSQKMIEEILQAKIARKRPEPKKPNILNRQRTRQLSLDCLDPSTADPIPSVSVTSSPEPIFNKNQLHFALKPENFDPQDSPNERFDFNRSSFDERITVEERDEGGSKSDNEEKHRALVYDQDDGGRGFSKRKERARQESQSSVESNPYASYQQRHSQKLRPKITKVSLSAIHGWGLFVMEPVAPGELIVEYVGEEIRTEVAEMREKKYIEQGKLVYMFSYDRDWVIDATMMGNAARFINHSCKPNCTAETKLVDGVRRIYIYSKSWIDKGQELTYDYKFPVDENLETLHCLCGEQRCRKTL